ncbi:IS3 family transposase [Desulfosoma caldarium]|uniref:IS3 family transposase n=1 Tax=Desulfosoma caldarium TaxID=610254 RepID=UPI0014727C85|nr:IS3 family transposase [Desulfosoma caldarium]
MNDRPRRCKPAGVDRQVEQAIDQPIRRYPRYGFRKITIMLCRLMGLMVNKKKAQRIIGRHGWTVFQRNGGGMRPRAQKKPSVAEGPHERWQRI